MDKIISIEDLVSIIKHNKRESDIEKLWNLPHRSEEYDKLKIKLPTVTPAGIFQGSRSQENIFQISGYMYFDIDLDDDTDVNDYKEDLTSRFKDIICLCGRSVGGRGLFFYVKVKDVTKENYIDVYEHLRTKVFCGLDIDNNAKGINRAHIIPYDSSVYYNTCISIDNPIKYTDTYSISRVNNKNVERGTLDIKKNNKEICITPSVSFIPIEEVLAKIKHETKVDVGDMLFKIEPVPFCKVYFPKEKIVDCKKHTTFRAYTQRLMYLNPGIDLLTIQSFINYVNRRCTTRPMITKEMMRTVEYEYNRIVQAGELSINLKVKTLHFNKRACISREEKSRLSKVINGLLKRLNSVDKIEKAKSELQQSDIRVTNKSIAERSGLTTKTIIRNSCYSSSELLLEINSYNYKC